MARSWEEMIRVARGVDKDQTWGETIAYVRGYILALEDVIKDIDRLRAGTPEDDLNIAMFLVQEKVQATWNETKATEKSITELSQRYH